MNQERYESWTPLDGIPRTLYVQAIHDDYEGFRVILKGTFPNDRTLRIAFAAAIAYRNINESYRSRTWASQNRPAPPGGLFMVANSAWVDWLVEEAGGVLHHRTVQHYAILTGEDCIDIVTEFPPAVEWLNG